MARVLIIDGGEVAAAELLTALYGDHETRSVVDFGNAVAELILREWEVLLLPVDELAVDDARGVTAALRRLQELPTRPEVILLARAMDVQQVARLLRLGAYEVLFVPIDAVALREHVANAAQLRAFRNERRRIQEQNRRHRVDLETLVQERTSQMDQIFESVPAMLFRSLVSASGQRRLTFVSRNCERLLGLSEHALLWELCSFETLVHPSERPAYFATRDAAEARATTFRFEGRFVLPSGQQRRLQLVAHPTPLAQGTVAWDGLLLDVSERAELQTQLLMTDRLAVIGSVSAALVHEVNNPLFCVTSNLSALAEELKSGANSSLQAQLLDEAQRGIGRIEMAISDLRSLARISGPAVAPVRLTEVLDTSARLALNEIRHRARLIRDYRAHPLVMADESCLAQVFLNVLIAAAQSIPEGDASGNVLEIVVWAEGNRVHVEVTDTSPGIPTERLRCALDPTEATAERLRSGVGLYVSQQVLAGLGGEIKANSFPGTGNHFHLLLPIVEQQAPAFSQPSLRVVRDRPLRILVVDDEELVVKALTRTLRGHSVTAATSGREAIELIRSQGSFDLVLCDVMMPDVTGAEVYDAARSIRPGAEDRIVFVTGGAFTRTASEFLNSVPNRRIEKPFSRASIEAIIREMAV